MNNRDYKQFGMGNYYHLYNRGNEKKDIFLDSADFTFLLERLSNYLFPEKAGLRMRGQIFPANTFSVVSYCLMPNHFHLLVKQNTEMPISKLVLRLCTSYSMYFNKKYQRVGHVFQDRYKMVPVDDNNYLVWLSAYIHQNPKVAGIVNNLEDYPWSSYHEFVSSGKGSKGRGALPQSLPQICEKEIILNQFANHKEYKHFIDESFEVIKTKKDRDMGAFLIDT